jgi:hypothetical protein
LQINSLPASNITEPKSAVAAPPPPPPPAPAKAAPAPKPAAEAKPAAATAPKDASAVAAAAKTTEGTKTEITDVKATGEANAEGEQTFTLKVNGKEYKATQTEIIALAQKARGAEQAMKQKAEIEKLANDLLTNFDNDTFGLLVKRHGKEKAKEIAIGMVKNLIAEEAKDPKDIELDELRAKAKENDAAQAQAKKEQEETVRKQKQGELYKTMLIEIDKELNDTHLPKDKLTLTRVLNYLAAGKKANGQVWTIKDAVKAVETEDMAHATHYAKRYVEGKLPSEKFREIFGEETFKKLNKEQIDLLKNADKSAKNNAVKQEANGAPAEVPTRKPRSLSKTKGSEGMSEREWRKQHGSLGGGL